MKKVYVLSKWTTYGDDFEIVAVYSSEALAEQAKYNFGFSDMSYIYGYEEFELLDFLRGRGD